jgi:hypothetical protein
MGFNWNVDKEFFDLFNAVRENKGYPVVNYETFREQTERRLHSMGVDEAAISQLSDGGAVHFGVGRFPLLVVPPRAVEFVIKPYDLHDPMTEREIMTIVSPSIAPQVYHYGNNFLAEEYLSPETWTPLTTLLEEDDLELIAIKGGEMHGHLAQMGIEYHHNHWLDQFFLNETSMKIIDFGTSRFFRTVGGGDSQFDMHVSYLKTNGLHDFVERFAYDDLFDSPLLGGIFDSSSVDRLSKLAPDAATAVTFFDLAVVAMSGIGEGLRIQNRYDAIHAAHELLPAFVEGFCASYVLPACDQNR